MKYKIGVNSITGVHSHIFRKGEEVEAIYLLNIEQHLTNGDITEIVPVEEPPTVAAESKKEIKTKKNELPDAGK